MILSRTIRKASLLLSAVVTLLATGAAAQQQGTDKTIQAIERNKLDNTPKSIRFSPETKWSESQAQEIFKKYLGLSSDNKMVLDRTTKTKYSTVSRYAQYFKGIKVETGTTVVNSSEGRVNFMTINCFRPDNSLSPVPAIAEKQALKYATAYVGAQQYAWEDAGMERMIKRQYKKDTTYMPKGQLVWMEDLSKSIAKSDRELHLAYKFDVYGTKPLSRQEIYIDANTGKVLFSNNLIKHAIGNSRYSGPVPISTTFDVPSGGFILHDLTRGGGVHTFDMGGSTSYGSASEFVSVFDTWPVLTNDSVAIDAQWGGEQVYDYFSLIHGRNSYDDMGSVMEQYVHYDVGYNNAFWNGSVMTYGDGTGCGTGFTPLTSLDVTAHEVGHGICQWTAGLFYEGESGAMNEGFSDCWGAAVENWANPLETDLVPKSVWRIGEEIRCGTPLRRMDNPKLSGDPDCYGGVNWVTTAGCMPSGKNDQCGVHTNSGVLNKWYYILTNGATGTNDLGKAYSVTGVGFATSQALLYETENALTPTSQYSDCRTASINAAIIMSSGNPCAALVVAVTNAWYAVGVGDPFEPCNSTIGFTLDTLNVSENAATTLCPASKTYNIGVKPYGSAIVGGNPQVTVSVARGTAVAGVDYTLSAPVLTFPAGSTATQNVVLTVFDNGAINDDKFLVLGFSFAAMGSPSTTKSIIHDSVRINIYNDDSIPRAGATEFHTLNTGTAVTCNLTSAFPGAQRRGIAQYLLYASELTAAGVRAGVPISQLAFNITQKNSTAPFIGYSITMGNTLFSDITASFVPTGSFTNVYTGDHSTVLGMDPIDFTTSFTWDGTSNVLVQVCYGRNAASAPGNDKMDGIDHSGYKYTSARNGDNGAGTGCGMIHDEDSVNTARPVMRFRQVVAPTNIETTLASTYDWDVKTGQDVYFYNGADLMARLNNQNNNLGCVNTTVSAAGVGFTPASFSPINRSLKEFTMTPTINGSTTTYDVTFYFTNTELNGVPPATLSLVKTTAPTDATVSTGNSVVVTPTIITGTNYVGFKGTFTGFSRFFLVDGPLCAAPPATITPAGPTTFCVGGSVQLDANTGTGLTYQWQDGSGNIPGATNASYIASGADNYRVRVSSGACSATSSVVTTTYATGTIGPIAGPAGVCVGSTVTLSNGTTGGTWVSSDPSVASIGLTTGDITGAAVGTVTITYTATTACGVASTTATFTVSTPATIAATTGTMTACAGTTTTLANTTPSGVWSSSNTALATVGTSGVVSATAAGTVNINYSVTNAFGCVSSAVATVTVNPLPTPVITPAGSTTLCVGGTLVLNETSGSGISYQWQLAGVDITGATTSAHTATSAGSFRVRITNSNGCVATSAAVVTTVSTIAIIPSVSVLASPGLLVCVAGTPVTFTPVPVNGGSTPAYQWYVNGVATSSAAPYTYTPANGDVVKCKLTSSASCASPDTAITTVFMTVGKLETPDVSLAATPGSTVCTGTKTTLTATPVFGGTAPSYDWFKNGAPVVAVGPSYTYIPVTGDKITVKLTSNYTCVTTPTVVSTPVEMTVRPMSVHKVSIYVTSPNIYVGQVDTFVAIAPYAGPTPTYQWFINGVALPGETGSIFVTTALKDGQTVTCAVTSSDACAAPGIAYSNGVKVFVSSGINDKNAGNSFTLVPNPTKGTFTINGSLKNTADSKVNIVITNMLGQTVYKQTTLAQDGSVNENISLGASLANGMYLVTVTSGEDHVVFHVVLDK